MKIDVYHIAKLANLPLSKDEAVLFEKQLDETLLYIENLNNLETKNIIPTSQVTGLENVTREDVAKTSLPQKEALKNARSTYNGFFKVPAILDL